MWGSSLTDSTARGKPDIEAVDVSLRISLLNELLEVKTKPIIFDADTGGKIEHSNSQCVLLNVWAYQLQLSKIKQD